MKKKVILFVSIGFVALVLMVTACFYVIPFNRLNDMILYANKNNADAYGQASWVSDEDMMTLDITDHSVDKENHYISVSTKKNIEAISLNKLVILCDIRVSVQDGDTYEEIKAFNEKKKVSFSFADFAWAVESVQDVNS